MHFRHPNDEQLGQVDIFLATTIICSLSTLNSIKEQYTLLSLSNNQHRASQQSLKAFHPFADLRPIIVTPSSALFLNGQCI